MSRIVNLNSPAKVRSQNLRSIAEVLRHLADKTSFDAESKDMAASLVYFLQEINASTEQTAEAWEKRGYWMKAERFLRNWAWSIEMAANLEDVIRNDAWDLLPDLLGQLLTYTADIQVKNMTRSKDTWHGAYERLMAEPPSEIPW
jgi:hypothetical protein